MKYFFLLGVFLSFSLFAFTPPEFKGNVLDEAGVLSETDKTSLHNAIEALRNNADVWSAVYILPTTNGESIEDVAEKVFQHWKLGQKDKDNGLLVIVAVNDRKMRIEVGYGLEGTITDFAANRVINDNLKPNFRNNNYAIGIIEGLQRLGRIRLDQEEVVPSTSQSPSQEMDLSKVYACIAYNFLLVGIFWMAFFFRRMTGRKYKLRWFGAGLLGGHAAAIGFSLFFSLFWGSGAPLEMMIPFNGIFMLCFGGIGLAKPLHVLFSDSAYAEWVGPWLKYDDEFTQWKTGFKEAEKNGTLFDFIKNQKQPLRPGSFGKLISLAGGSSNSSSRSSSSSSSSWSSRSSSSSSSSSSGGGRSGGGGSSGSW